MDLDTIYKDLPPRDLLLETNEVHLWVVFLDQPDPLLQGLHKTLSDDECERADRFVFQKDRNRFIVGRGVLRVVLGRYLKTAADSIIFRYGIRGKPEVANAPAGNILYFNLSHSEGLGLFAFSRRDNVGVDVEYIRDVPEMEKIVDRFFSEKEAEKFRTLPKNKKREAFFDGWTRKEAYVKALGDGLLMPLNSFDVSFLPGEPARLLSINGDEKEGARWSIKTLPLGTNYTGALAVESTSFDLKMWQWRPEFLS